MSSTVIALVLFAALLHASWNALLKSSADKLASLAVMTIGAGLGGLPLILYFPAPLPASWPYIALSAVLHTGYNLFLIRAYRIGDFSQAYPIARGSSPLLVTLGAALFVGEQMNLMTLLGVILISIGIISLAKIKGGGHVAVRCVDYRCIYCCVHCRRWNGRTCGWQRAGLLWLAIRAG